jgi:benzoyl-CoA reductase/2-hydroxyglutaryl-CoA dehydratase subunit BcrC/BadD/HgdB
MTAEIVNLNKVRKARDRANRERDAQENRIKYGQTKSDRNLFEARNRKWQHDVDASRRQSDGLDDDDTGPSNAS